MKEHTNVREANALNTYSSWVTEYIEEGRQLRALAFWANGQLIEECLLDIKGTPCEAVIDSASLVHYPDNMIDLFPDRPMVKKVSSSGMTLRSLDVFWALTNWKSKLIIIIWREFGHG